MWIAVVHVPETKDEDATSPDWTGAAAASVGLAAVTYALIEQSRGGMGPVLAAVIGVAGLGVFVLIERSSRHPMLPLDIFRSHQFTGANLTTFAVYAALGGTFFLLVLQLQVSLRYSAIKAGTALMQRLISVREQLHSNMIGLHVEAGNWLTSERLQLLTHGLFPGSAGAEEAQERAALLLGGQLKLQAYTLAYADGYLAIALVAALAIVLIACMKPMKIYFDAK